MTYILFAVALSLSAIAAYYAVMGLIAIFAAAVVPIAIMGSLLELSKLTVASWLYQNWKNIPHLLKGYFTIALFVLMMLTSMGIFGFLSKAHLDQAVPSGDVAAKLALIDEKIKTEKENIDGNRKQISQLDQQVDQTIGRTTDASGADKAITIRRGQQKERTRLLSEISDSQAKIAKYQEERAPIASEVRKVEAEVGPIKYIAAVIYGDTLDDSLLEKAVRIVTIMIVLVFDPLAVLLLIAANWNLRNGVKQSWKSIFIKEQAEPVLEDRTPQEPVLDVDEEEQVVEEQTEPEEPQSEESEEQPSVSVPSEEIEIPEIELDEEKKDWEPQLFYIKRGDVTTNSRYPDTQEMPPKTASFVKKTIDLLRSPGIKSKTIEMDVEDLQKK